MEVIPGDAYKVEKSGDETSGFFTKVVFTTDNEKKKKKKKQQSAAAEQGGKKKKPSKAAKAEGKKTDTNKGNEENSSKADGNDDATATLSKKERQKLKRKRKRDEAKERKRLLKEKEGGEVGQTSSNDDANDSDKQRRKRAKLSESNSSSKASSSSITDVDDQPGDTTSTKEEEEEEATLQSSITQLQTTWSISTSVTLHTTLATGLHNLQYIFPTPIQSATLPASILGRRDIVGAAPTGSGKTLSFGLPILQYLLETCTCATDGRRRGGVQQLQQLPLQALILTPTRELALQVTCELQKVSLNTIKIGTIVGGFAEVKQRRTLEKVKPPILVATPGRLWELVSCLFVMFRRYLNFAERKGRDGGDINEE